MKTFAFPMPFLHLIVSPRSPALSRRFLLPLGLTAKCAFARMLMVATALALSGCSTSPPGEGLLDKTLGLVGLQQKVELPPASALPPELLKPSGPTKIPLRIHAGDQLNTDGGQRSLSLVVKIYALKGHEALSRATYQDFVAGKDLGEEVLSSREVVLTPGQRYEVEEPLPKDTAFLAVVALFRSPAEARWRFVFDVKESGQAGLMLGAHRCALSVTRGAAVQSSPESLRLAGVICPPA